MSQKRASSSIESVFGIWITPLPEAALLFVGHLASGDRVTVPIGEPYYDTEQVSASNCAAKYVINWILAMGLCPLKECPPKTRLLDFGGICSILNSIIWQNECMDFHRDLLTRVP